MSILPKTRIEAYRGHKIVVTYNPELDQWDWWFEHKLALTGQNATESHAVAVAKRRVDKLLERA